MHMKMISTQFPALRIFMASIFFLAFLSLKAQTNVFDDVIATSPDHTYLKAALEQEGLDAALQDDISEITSNYNAVGKYNGLYLFRGGNGTTGYMDSVNSCKCSIIY